MNGEFHDIGKPIDSAEYHRTKAFVEYMRQRGFAMLWAVACHPAIFCRMVWANRNQTVSYKWVKIARFIEQVSRAKRMRKLDENRI